MTHNNWTYAHHAPKQDLAIYASVVTDHEADEYGLPAVENTVSNDLLDISTATVIESGL